MAVKVLVPLLLLSGCLPDLSSLLPSMTPTSCEATPQVTAISIDAGAAAVTVSCQVMTSACDGGTLPTCPSQVCLRVDWVQVPSTLMTACHDNPVQGAAQQVTCFAAGLGTFSAVVAAPASMPALPLVIDAAVVPQGAAAGLCDATCAVTANRCACDESITGVNDPDCATAR